MVRCDDEWMVRMRVWIWDLRRYYYILVAILHALRMQTTTKLLGSPDFFIFYFSLKLIGADHGLHTSGGVQIS